MAVSHCLRVVCTELSRELEEPWRILLPHLINQYNEPAYSSARWMMNDKKAISHRAHIEPVADIQPLTQAASRIIYQTGCHCCKFSGGVTERLETGRWINPYSLLSERHKRNALNLRKWGRLDSTGKEKETSKMFQWFVK
ncbi:hypothetical protein NQZ68_012453 [Dissostichus eleginoides]|nr:hypothetical protein NQZ68_012453 [Dissostichus eleginoides]